MMMALSWLGCTTALFPPPRRITSFTASSDGDTALNCTSMSVPPVKSMPSRNPHRDNATTLNTTTMPEKIYVWDLLEIMEIIELFFPYRTTYLFLLASRRKPEATDIFHATSPTQNA